MGRLYVAVALLFAMIPLVALARRINVAYPIVLVATGLAIGFIPHVPPITLPPEIVLLVFLPPLLYWEALTAPIGAMRENAGIVRSLVIGLVLATTAGVAVVAHAIIPNFSWPAAFVIGAIVSPTDAVAFAPIAERIGVPARTIAIIEAEGLLNDGTALILYASAVAAVSSGDFSIRGTLFSFAVSVIGSIALGVGIGSLVTWVWRRLRDTDLQTAMSIIAPFLAYLPAHSFGISGVLAVVTTSLYVNRFAIGALTPEARQRAIGFGQTVAFLMNTGIFLLVGLQLHPVLQTLVVYSRRDLIWMALAISATVVVIRFVWIFGQRYVLRSKVRIADRPEDEWKMRLITSWAGFRGGISLAAALAIPHLLPSGAGFPRRQLVIFLTYGVIFATLIGQGLTFPALLQSLRLRRDDGGARALRDVLGRMSRVALARLAELEAGLDDGDDTFDVLRRRYTLRSERYVLEPEPGELEQARIYHEASRELIAVQRRELTRLHTSGIVDGALRTRVQAMLDLEELEIEGLVTLVDNEIPATP